MAKNVKAKKVARVDRQPDSSVALPRRPTNAYQALAMVAQRILDEPLNYYQGSWGVDPFNRAMVGLPEGCGTAYCVGGHLEHLTGVHAAKVIGGDVDQDFYELTWKTLFDSGLVAVSTPGTKTYAKAGAAMVRRFMRTHAARLKATPIKATR